MIIACGLDFGTSNSSMSVVDEAGNVEIVTFRNPTRRGTSGNARVQEPSAVYVSRNRNDRGGQEALRLATQTVGTDTGALFLRLKKHLSSPNFRRTKRYERFYELEDLLAILIREMTLGGCSDGLTGISVDRVAVGHPVVFPGTEGPQPLGSHDLAMGRLASAARLAGFRQTALVNEAAAAAQSVQIANGLMLTLDFGAGTFDTALVRFNKDRGKVLSSQGALVGGDDVDRAIFEEKLVPALGIGFSHRGRTMPNRFRHRLSTRDGLLGVLNRSDSVDLRVWVSHHSLMEGGEALFELEDSAELRQRPAPFRLPGDSENRTREPDPNEDLLPDLGSEASSRFHQERA